MNQFVVFLLKFRRNSYILISYRFTTGKVGVGIGLIQNSELSSNDFFINFHVALTLSFKDVSFGVSGAVDHGLEFREAMVCREFVSSFMLMKIIRNYTITERQNRFYINLNEMQMLDFLTWLEQTFEHLTPESLEDSYNRDAGMDYIQEMKRQIVYY